MDDLGLFASILGHVGDGNFHESIMYNKRDPKERQKVEQCVKNMVRRAIDMDGTCTGEHSIGWGKKDSLLLEVGPETVEVMRALKKALDPLWILNPGKIMDVPGASREEGIRSEHVGYVQRPDGRQSVSTVAGIASSGGLGVGGVTMRAASQATK